MEGIPRYNPDVSTRVSQSSLEEPGVVNNNVAASLPGRKSVLSSDEVRLAGRELTGRSVDSAPVSIVTKLAEVCHSMQPFHTGLKVVSHALDPSQQAPMGRWASTLHESVFVHLHQSIADLTSRDAFTPEQLGFLKTSLEAIQRYLAVISQQEQPDSHEVDQCLESINQHLLLISQQLTRIWSQHTGGQVLNLSIARGQVEAFQEYINILSSAHRGNHQQAVHWLQKFQVHLNTVESGLRLLNLDDSYGIVARPMLPPEGGARHPDILPPRLEAPSGCNLQQLVNELRSSSAHLICELNKSGFDQNSCHHGMVNLGNYFGELSSGLYSARQAFLQAHQKAQAPITLEMLARGLAIVKAGRSGLNTLMSGLQQLFEMGASAVWSLGKVCWKLPALLTPLAGGILWSAKGAVWYSGVLLLTPIYIVKKLCQSEGLWWQPPVPAFPAALPPEFELSSPLEDDELFEEMYRLLTEAMDDVDEPSDSDDVDTSDSFSDSVSGHSTDSIKFEPEDSSLETDSASTESMSIQESRVEKSKLKLSMLEERLLQLDSELSFPLVSVPGHVSGDLEQCQMELSLLRQELQPVTSASSSEEESFIVIPDEEVSDSLLICQDVLDRHNHLMCYARQLPMPEDDSFAPIISSMSVAEQVLHWYPYPDRLSETFASARQVHQFQRYRLRVLKNKVSEAEFKLIESALAQYKQETMAREAAVMAGQKFFRIFHGRFASNASEPSMEANPEKLSEQVLEQLSEEKQRVSEQLSEMLLRESEAVEAWDWSFIQQKAQLMAYLNMLNDHLDHPERIERKIHYFTGLGFGEEQIEKHLAQLMERAQKVETELSPGCNHNAHELELLELQLEELENIHGALKSNLYNLYYKGWVERDSIAFDRLSDLVALIKRSRHLLVEAQGAFIESNPEILRGNIKDQLKTLSDNLKKELPESQRISDIDEALELLESDDGLWSKEKWLQLNLLCNQKESMLRNTIARDYPGVYHYAREFGRQLAEVARTEIDRFRMTTSGEFDTAMREVWEDWEKHHSERVDLLYSDSCLADWHDDPCPEQQFRVRQMLSDSREKYLNKVSNGYLHRKGQLPPVYQQVNEFFAEVIKKVAANSARYVQASNLISDERKTEIFQRALQQLQKLNHESGSPCFPLIHQLAEAVVPGSGPVFYNLEGMMTWAGQAQEAPLETSDREQVNYLFMRYRDELVKQAVGK